MLTTSRTLSKLQFEIFSLCLTILYQEMPAELSQDQKNVQHAMITMVENHLHWSVNICTFICTKNWHENAAKYVAKVAGLTLGVNNSPMNITHNAS